MTKPNLLQKSIIAVSLSLVVPVIPVHALDTLSYDKINLDSSIVSDSNYKLPSRILVVPIIFPDPTAQINDLKWYKGIFYYTIDRLGLSNIPFHYVVSSKGDIYQASQGDERKVLVNDIGDDSIIVGYLASENSSVVDPQAQSSMANLLLDICNRNDINPNKIITRGLQFSKDPTTKAVSITSQKLFGNWQTSIGSIVDSIRSKYSPQPKLYTITVGEIKLASTSAAPGSTVSGTITLTNSGVNGLYGGTNKEIVVTKVGKGSSMFYLNNSWLSQTQFGVMSDTDTLMPGKTQTFNFKIKTPLYYGDIAETFGLNTLDGQSINSSNFQIRINVSRSGKKIIQINKTITNYLKVHTTPSTISPEVARAATGDRFFVIDTTVVDNVTFYKIDLGDGRQGWVVSNYVTVV